MKIAHIKKEWLSLPAEKVCRTAASEMKQYE